MPRIHARWALLLLILASSTATAHVVVDRKSAAPGSYKAVFGIPHGCSGAATTAVIVTVPEGFIGVKPAPKPGWTLNVERGSYARTYDYFHGMKVSDGVRSITWSGGSLDDTHYDEFMFVGFISDAFKPGETIYFPVKQVCGDASIVWDQVPSAGQSTHDLKAPAPAVSVTAPVDDHSHHGK